MCGAGDGQSQRVRAVQPETGDQPLRCDAQCGQPDVGVLLRPAGMRKRRVVGFRLAAKQPARGTERADLAGTGTEVEPEDERAAGLSHARAPGRR